MALAKGFTDNRAAAYATSCLAGVGRGAEVTVVAGGSVRFIGEATLTRNRITEGCGLTLVGFGTGDACLYDAVTALAALSGGACATVIADGSVWFEWVGADARSRITGSCQVALIERCTDRVGATATVSVGAGFTCTTSVTVVTCNPVGFGRLLTESCAVVADAGFQTIAGFRAANRGCRGARSSLTGLAVGAEATIIANCVVGLGWVAAEASGYITDADLMALVEGRTHHSVARIAASADADIIHGACVSVVAGRSQVFRWIRANACLW